MTARVLRITDGTTTVDFTDAASGYRLLNHTPAVARRDPGNPELYTRVVEELEISVSGSSRAQIASRVNTLTSLIDQAQRLWNGENVDPVLYQYQVEGSSLSAPLQALITGPPPGQSAVVLPAWYDSAFSAGQVGSQADPLVWRFERRGALLDAAEQQTVSPATTYNPGVMEVTFGSSAPLPAPVRLEINFSALSGDDPIGGAILIGKDSSHLVFVEGEDGSGSEYSTVADGDASGGNVLRRTPTTTLAQVAGSFGTLGVDSSVRRMAAVLACRNNSATITYRVRFALTGLQKYSRPVYIEPGMTDPQLVYLGVADSGYETIGADLKIETVPDGTGGVAHSLDIDAIGLVAVDDDVGRVILRPDDFDQLGDEIYDHALLSRRRPLVASESDVALIYSGNPIVAGGGDSLAVLVLAVTDDYFRLRANGTPGSALGIGMTADRRAAYLVPQ